MPSEGTIRLEGVRIIFRNFTGRPGKYNAEGERNFAVVLDDEKAAVLLDDGWNVKRLNPKENAEEGAEPVPFLPVKVKYGTRYPPRVAMITSRGLTDLKEHEVEVLDRVDILSVDMMIRPYTWEGSETGLFTAYLHSIYVTIQEDELELKYADLPRAADE